MVGNQLCGFTGTRIRVGGGIKQVKGFIRMDGGPEMTGGAMAGSVFGR